MMKGVAKLRKTDYVISNDPPLLPSTNSGFGACQLYTLSRPKPRATYCGKKSGATAQLFTCMEPSFSSACRTGRPRHPTIAQHETHSIYPRMNISQSPSW